MNDDYEIRLQQVRERSRLIIDHFARTWQGRISDDVLNQHITNIEYFASGHLTYSADADNLRSLDQVTGWKMYDFITDWLPRKGLVVSAHRVKSYLATFDKLFKFMGVHGYMEPENAAKVLEMLKEDRQSMIDAVVTYDDPIEEQSLEEFQAHMQGLVGRWKTVHQQAKDASTVEEE
ncbi:MAG: hypothetical protein GY832_10050 [Chloroflexi bacterium]|nr:hypothetical protein [Chloroflexota bacterium]